MSAEEVHDSPAEPLRPSKTQRKHESHDLQALGAKLAELPAERLASLAIPEPLLEALQAYQRTRSFEARRRQMQYVGKLMRTVDAQPLRAAVAELQLGRARDALALHRAEHWRAELLADDTALTRWAEAHDAADLQQLRSLVRAARKDAALTAEKRSGRAARDLFRYLREHSHDD